MTIANIRLSEHIAKLEHNVVCEREGSDETRYWRHQKKDGAIINAAITSYITFWDGREVGVELAQDIIEKKKVDQLLRSSQLQNTGVLDARARRAHSCRG